MQTQPTPKEVTRIETRSDVIDYCLSPTAEQATKFSKGLDEESLMPAELQEASDGIKAKVTTQLLRRKGLRLIEKGGSEIKSEIGMGNEMYYPFIVDVSDKKALVEWTYNHENGGDIHTHDEARGTMDIEKEDVEFFIHELRKEFEIRIIRTGAYEAREKCLHDAGLTDSQVGDARKKLLAEAELTPVQVRDRRNTLLREAGLDDAALEKRIAEIIDRPMS